MHAQRVMHRDLKPGNLFLDGDMNIKIGDFGLATLLHMNSQEVCGTLEYMAPEMFCGLRYSERVDLWSLGVIL
jgi:cell cycle serine/threonine-protein kinase CDC5/MSD2